MKRILVGSSLAALSFFLAGAVAWAQATAQISGRITDQSGAVLPGVTVTATQTATGLVRTAVTADTGSYVLPNLPTGPYRLEVALSGFRTYEQTGIVLQVGATPVIDVSLVVGSVEETVSVEASTPLVDVRSAGISAVVENERILELPLQGRQVTDLLVLAGAAVQTGTPARGVPGGVNISVAGGLPFGVAYLLDGATHNNPQNNTNLPLPFPDALQEFRVATSGLSAENGMHSGASVNAVTKSGTNRFRGNVFEFLRDRHFNATSPFARIGPDGTREDDGLRRHQFGGTLGGPIVRDRLFFFGAYQGTIRRQVPASNIAFVPTAQMLAGDFTAITSPACTGGRQITLSAPFVNNRIAPALFSPAAVNLVGRLPATTHPCGEITFETTEDRDEHQPIARVDFQVDQRHSVFGRYLGARITIPPAYAGGSDNILKSSMPGSYNLLHSVTLGDTMVLSPTLVNAVRGTVNYTKVSRFQTPLFSPQDLGINVYSYPPGGQFPLEVTGAFELQPGQATKRDEFNTTYALSDDVTLVRGGHQFGFGGIVQFWRGDFSSSSRTGGTWIIDGRVTGLSLADLMIGRVTTVEHGGPNILKVNNWYTGWYAQDSWRASSRLTINAGVRWEPYFGQNVENNAIVIFNMDNFLNGVKSGVFRKAPAGLIYPGDPGFPEGQTGLNKQWTNFAPRAGVAWDVHGDGRLAVRSSYSMGYDFMAGEYHNINAGAPPFGNRSIITDPPGGLDDPYRHLGGDPHPIVTGPDTEYVAFGAFGTMNPDINSPRVQQWNVTVEQQVGANWGLSVTYLGSYSDRLWAQTALNPGMFMGLGSCTLQGVSYRVCSMNANLNVRRQLYQMNPREAQFIGSLDLNSDVGYQEYNGLKLSAQRRGAGISLNGSYTLSRCTGTPTTNAFNQISSGYTDPDNPSFDEGPCDQDHTHLATLTVGYETPDVGRGPLRVLASHWRVTGIYNVRSGDRLNILSGRDNAFNGIRNQRPDKVSDDFYANPRTLTNYFNRSAFAQPASGTLGNLTRNAAVGPAYWNVDLGISRLIPIGTQRLELRIESFNVLNHFNWGNPQLNFNSAQFGRITSLAGTPPNNVYGTTRIMQFGVKYDF
ncbi:MAG: TonB-dependent receptor [Acidobacteria bacterium]|nr:TonB-dependent receptor [Acidobacteriota bacterium]